LYQKFIKYLNDPETCLALEQQNISAKWSLIN
jgi:hypothetical protein